MAETLQSVEERVNILDGTGLSTDVALIFPTEHGQVPQILAKVKGVKEDLAQVVLVLEAELNKLGKYLKISESQVINLPEDLAALQSRIQIAQADHTITADDILGGFCFVPITWPTPWPDLNYVTLFGIVDADEEPNRDFSAGDQHNTTLSGFDAVVDFVAAIPLVQGQQDDINSNTPATLAFSLPVQTLYQMTLYYQSIGDGDPDQSISPTVTWTDPQGNVQTLAYPYLGPVQGGSGGNPNWNNLQSYSIPYLAKGGSTITVSFAYAGTAGNSYPAFFHYNLSIRIVAMPNNATDIQEGDVITVKAVSIHQ